GGHLDCPPSCGMPIPARGVALLIQRVDQPVHRIEEADEAKRRPIAVQLLPPGAGSPRSSPDHVRFPSYLAFAATVVRSLSTSLTAAGSTSPRGTLCRHCGSIV